MKETPGGTGSSYPLLSDVVANKFKANLSAAVRSVTGQDLRSASLMLFKLKHL